MSRAVEGVCCRCWAWGHWTRRRALPCLRWVAGKGGAERDRVGNWPLAATDTMPRRWLRAIPTTTTCHLPCVQGVVMAAAQPLAPAAAPHGAAGDEALSAKPLPPAADALAAAEARAAAEAAAAGRRAYEADQAALRALRMALRDVGIRLLTDRRWRMFAAPHDADAEPEYYEKVGLGCLGVDQGLTGLGGEGGV